MNYKKFVIIFVLVLLLGLSGVKIYNLILNNSKSLNINYDDSNENIDWDLTQENDVNLNSNAGSLTIKESGTYNLTGTINGGIIIDGDSETLVKLVLDGVNIVNSNGPAINIKKAKIVLIYLNDESINYVEDGKNYIELDESGEPNGAIFSKSDLLIDGSGTLNITSNYEDGIVSKDGLKILNGNININSKDDAIRGKDYVVIKKGNIFIETSGDGIKSTNTTDSSLGYILIEEGNIEINASNDGIQAETSLIINGGTFKITTGNGSSNSSTWMDTDSSKGLKAGTNITISNGEFNLDTSDDAIHSNNEISIEGGIFEISSGDDGIHADTLLSLKDAVINVIKSYEGIESLEIIIESGNYLINSNDDGINAAGGNDSSSFNRPGANQFSSGNGIITINGGNIKVISNGDGIDANGSVYVNGGTIYVDGPTNSGNGALDYDKEFVMKGGTLIAVGASGMAQSISSSSSINAINVFCNQNSSGIIMVKDSQNNEIISYTPSKNYSLVVIASSLLEKGSTYDIYIDEEKYGSSTISNVINQIGTTGGMNQGLPPSGNNKGGMRR